MLPEKALIFQLQDLDEYSASELPESCGGCGWWQGFDRGWPSTREAEAWTKTAMNDFGAWGKIALGDGRLLGAIQYGPCGLFPRTRKLPCGPVSRDAVLLTCNLVAEGALESIRKSLLTATISEFEKRDVEAVETFALDGEAGPGECRFFRIDFLRDCGFYPVRSAGRLKIMRFEIGGTQRVKPIKKLKPGLLQRIKNRSAAPVPVATAGAVSKQWAALPSTPCSRNG